MKREHNNSHYMILKNVRRAKAERILLRHYIFPNPLYNFLEKLRYELYFFAKIKYLKIKFKKRITDNGFYSLDDY